MMKKIAVMAFFLGATLLLSYAAWEHWARNHRETAASDLALAPVADYAALARVTMTEDILIKGYGATAALEALADRGLPLTILSTRTWDSLAADSAFDAKNWSATLKSHATFRPWHVETLWLREFGPLVSMGRQQGRAWQGLRYFTPDPGSDAPTRASMAAALSPTLGGQESTSPYAHNGANLLASERFCLMSQDSADGSFEAYPGIPAKLFQKDSGCARLFMIPKAPHPLIDRYALLVSDSVAFVAELRDDTLAAIYPDASLIPPEFKALQRRLDEAATSMANLVKVERLPLPLPHRGVWRTYTNAFLANGLAVLPRFRQFGWGHGAYPDAALTENYERQAEMAFRRQGYQVVWASGDALAYNGGGWRSVFLGAPDHAATPRVGLVGGSHRL